jgi:hypothetical protein
VSLPDDAVSMFEANERRVVERENRQLLTPPHRTSERDRLRPFTDTPPAVGI